MKRTIAFLLACMFLVACGPSVNPQLVKKVDGYFTTEGKNYGAAKKFMAPMPLAVGQYVVMGVTEDKTKRSITRIAIVGREKGGWIFEYYNLSGSQEGIMQMCVTGMENVAKSGDMSAVDILWVKMKDKNGQVQTIEGPAIMMMKSYYKKTLENTNVKVTVYTDGGVIKVPAGAFAATNVIKTESKIMGKTYKATGWHHSSVPINGLVKSVSDDGEYVMELLQFGTSGAVSMLK
jgi:hypothetical protein